jgi:hypothetical protein
MLRTACRPGLHAEACALTVATQIGVWPLTAQMLLTVAPYGVLANLAVVPAVGSTMILGLAQIATDRLPLVPDVLRRSSALASTPYPRSSWLR